MIPHVTNLDGIVAKSIIWGQDYLVPCVYGIPVICPSHTDEGNEGATMHHWHTDDRFGDVGRGFKYWAPKDTADLKMELGDDLRSSIIRDSGESVKMERKTATKSQIWASGGVFSSVCWLYEHYGHLKANNNHCVHHHTPLVEQNNCLECPAHSLKYNFDGSPRYRAPFYISTSYIDFNNNINRIKAPLCTGHNGIKFTISGNFDPFPLLRLEDSNGETIMEDRSKVCLTSSAKPGQFHDLTVSISAWPRDGSCPGLAKSDPRDANEN